MKIRQLNECFRILERAISDVGYWTWWTSDLPNSFQLEFSGVQLWNPPLQDGQPPSSTIALRFHKPISVSFFMRDLPENLKKNWYESLHNDAIEPFAINHDCFCINDKVKAQDLLTKAKGVKTIFGVTLENKSLFDSNIIVCFWAGSVGSSVFAENLEIRNHQGRIEISEVPVIEKKWWDYWKEYWKKKGTKEELPKDYACEVTIPLTGNK